jgi:hypothetical protein
MVEHKETLSAFNVESPSFHAGKKKHMSVRQPRQRDRF